MTPQRNIAFTPARTALLFGGIALCFIVSYSIYAALPILEGPSIRATAVTGTDGDTAIQGTTKRVSYLEINGASIPLTEDGSFSIERAYPVGYTAITITVRDRFGRSLTKSLSAVTGKILTNNNATSTHGTQ